MGDQVNQRRCPWCANLRTVRTVRTAPSGTAAQLAAMVDDAESRLLFLDAASAAKGVPWPARAQQIRLDDGAFAAWLLPAGPAGKRPGLALQPHLLLRHHRHAAVQQHHARQRVPDAGAWRELRDGWRA